MKILVIRLSSLGDIVLTEPVIRILSEQYPDAELHFLTKPVFCDLISTFPEKIVIRRWQENLHSLFMLAKENYDLVIDLHNKPNTALIRLFSGRGRKVIYDKKRKLRKKIVKKKTQETINSTLDLYLSVFDKLKLSYRRSNPVIRSSYLRSGILKENNLINKGYIILFPGATSFTKRWPQKYFARLIELIDNWDIVIAGNSKDISIAENISRNSRNNIINLTGKTSIPELISLISGAQVVIVNDSGPAHLAAALGKAQITLFGGTSPKLGFTPLNNKGVIVSKNLPCSPCSLHGTDSCPLGHFNCMEKISPDEILKELEKILTNT